MNPILSRHHAALCIDHIVKCTDSILMVGDLDLKERRRQHALNVLLQQNTANNTANTTTNGALNTNTANNAIHKKATSSSSSSSTNNAVNGMAIAQHADSGPAPLLNPIGLKIQKIKQMPPHKRSRKK